MHNVCRNCTSEVCCCHVYRRLAAVGIVGLIMGEIALVWWLL